MVNVIRFTKTGTCHVILYDRNMDHSYYLFIDDQLWSCSKRSRLSRNYRKWFFCFYYTELTDQKYKKKYNPTNLPTMAKTKEPNLKIDLFYPNLLILSNGKNKFEQIFEQSFSKAVDPFQFNKFLSLNLTFRL